MFVSIFLSSLNLSEENRSDDPIIKFTLKNCIVNRESDAIVNREIYNVLVY